MDRRKQQHQYRKYYLDHPTCLNHQQHYIAPINNQYTILSNQKDPYHIFDHFSIEIQNRNRLRLPKPERIAQIQPNPVYISNSFVDHSAINAANGEVRELQRLLEIKEREYELDKIISEVKSNSSSILPLPIYMPFPYMLQQFQGNNCHSHCQDPQTQRQEKKIRSCRASLYKYRQLMTENHLILDEALQKRKIEEAPKEIPRQKMNKDKRKQPKKMARRIKQKKKIGNRFRICAYAIYFSIFLRYFSMRFSVNRYNKFKKKYIEENGAKLIENNRQIYYKMLKIDLRVLLKRAQLKIPPISKSTEDIFNIVDLLKFENAIKIKDKRLKKLQDQSKQTIFLKCSEFIKSWIQKIQEILGKSMGELGEGLTVGCLNQSFVIDNAFLPHQILFMKFHHAKGYLRLTQESERVLLLIRIFVKLGIFNVLLQLDNNREWLEQWPDELDKQGETLLIIVELSAKILFILCQQAYEKGLESHSDTNYGEVDDRFQIEPCNPLIYAHSIRKRRELFKKQEVKQSNLLIFGIDQLDEVNTIMKEPFFKTELTNLRKSLDEAVFFLRNLVKAENRRIYRDIFTMTIQQEYLIFNGTKIGSSQKSILRRVRASGTMTKLKNLVNLQDRSSLKGKENQGTTSILASKKNLPAQRRF